MACFVASMVLLSMLIISRLPAFLNLPVFTAERSYGLTLFLVSLNIFFVHSSEFLALGAKAEINIDGKTMEATKQAMKTPMRFSFHGLFCSLHGLAINVDR